MSPDEEDNGELYACNGCTFLFDTLTRDGYCFTCRVLGRPRPQPKALTGSVLPQEQPDSCPTCRRPW